MNSINEHPIMQPKQSIEKWCTVKPSTNLTGYHVSQQQIWKLLPRIGQRHAVKQKQMGVYGSE